MFYLRGILKKVWPIQQALAMPAEDLEQQEFPKYRIS